MAGKVNAQMSTKIALDTVGASKSVTTLATAVKSLTSGWKAQEAMLRSTGDYLKAAEARYNGLGQAIEKQQSKITLLKEKQQGLNVETQDGAKAYLKFQDQIDKASVRLNSMTAQQNRAKEAIEKQKSGIIGLQGAYKTLTTANKAYVDRLNAEGSKASATVAKYDGLKKSLTNLKAQYKAQEQALEKVASDSGKTSEAYLKQRTELDKTGKAVAEAKNEMKSMNSTIKSLQPTGIKRIDNAVVSVKDHSGKMATSVKTSFASMKASATTAGLAVGVLGANLIKGAKMASSLQNTYVENSNLMSTAGEKQAEVQKNVNKMQADGKKYSVEYGESQQNIAKGYQELIKRGYTSTQALGSMKSILQASKASGDDFDDTMKVTTSTLEAFGMKSNNTATQMKNTSKVANALAMAADATSTNFSDLGVGMSYVGTTAKQAGLTLENTATTLGVLSNNGIESDKAGTGLRKTINSLISPTKTGTDALKQYGLTVKDFKDKSGKLKDTKTIFDEINKAVPKGDQANFFHNVFGTTGQNAAAVLANNTKALKDTNAQVQSAYKNNYVGKLANSNMKSTQNSTKQFKEASKAVQIELGSALMPALAESAKGMAKAFDSKNFQKGLKSFAKGLGSVSMALVKFFEYLGKHQTAVKVFGSVLVTAFAFTKVIRGISTFIKSMKLMGTAIKVVFGLVTKNPFTIWITVIGTIITALVALYKHNAKFRKFVNTMAKDAQKALGAIGKYFSKLGKDTKKDLAGVGKVFSTAWSSVEKTSSKGASAVGKYFSNLGKDFKNDTSNMWNVTKKGFSSGWSTVTSASKKGADNVGDWFNNMKTATQKTAVNMFNNHKKTFQSGYNVMNAETKTWQDFTSGHWDDLAGDLKNIANSISKFMHNLFSDLYNWLNKITGGRLGDMVNLFKSAFSKVGSIVEGATKAVHHGAVSIARGVLSPINSMLEGLKKGLNWVLDKVGAGKISASWSIPLPGYANGTGKHPGGLAKVNDGPGEHYREMYRLPNGEVGMFPKVRNMVVPLPKDAEVLDGERSYQLSKMMGIPSYASGVGSFFKGLFDKGKDLIEDADNIMKHPLQFLEQVFDKFVDAKSNISFAKDIIGKFPSTVAKGAEKWIKKLFDTFMGSMANPAGAGAKRWIPVIKAAAAKMKVNLSDSGMAAVLHRITQESNGNATVTNNWDSNAKKGTPSKGLLQYILPTLQSWVPKGVKADLGNGYVQLLALFNDSNWLRDISVKGGWGPTGHKRMANGGLVSKNQMIEIAENNQPEMVIPMSSLKRSRGWELLGEVMSNFTNDLNLGSDNAKEVNEVSELKDELHDLNDKFDNMLTMFSTLLGMTADQTQAVKDGAYDKTKQYKQQAKDLKNKRAQTL